MYKAILFLAAILLLLVVVYAKPIEGFTTLMGVDWTEMNEGTPAALYAKLPIKQPKVVDLAEAGIGDVQPSPPSAGTLPSAPAPQRSAETPNPYRDPTNEPAKYIQLLEVKENLQAFFGFQAFMLEDRNDPAIQIPLTRARADLSDLVNVASVMERNPGLPSRINNKQLDDIRANLQYLREILHDLEASGAIQPQQAIVNVEGFTEKSTSTETTQTENQVSMLTGPRATLDELKEFRNKVIAEITRLSASGTSDPVIQGRISLLDNIKVEIIDVIERLQDGRLTATTVPIYKSEIDAALPYLGNPSDPLPSLVKDYGLPEAIRNLFPGGLSPKDKEEAAQINNILKGYMKNLFEGSSWGLNLSYKYDNPNIAKLNARTAEDTKRTLELLAASGETSLSTGLPGVTGTASLTGYDITESNQGFGKPDFDQTYTGYESGLPGISNSRLLPEPKSGGLDWKERSSQIRDQIRRRGLNPSDFGALPENTEVSDNFSWRGYTQMMCMRLNTTTDPGLATTVGCPAQTWQGWRD